MTAAMGGGGSGQNWLKALFVNLCPRGWTVSKEEDIVADL